MRVRVLEALHHLLLLSRHVRFRDDAVPDQAVGKNLPDGRMRPDLRVQRWLCE